MALFSLKKISLLAENRQVYLRGISGYNAGWVKESSATPDPLYARRLTARVEEPSAAYRVEVGFDHTGEAEHIACGCSRFRSNHRGCKHIVAALVDLYYRDMTAAPTADTAAPAATAEPTVSDPAASRLIDRYLTAQRVRMTVEEQTLPPVTLTPTLILTGHHPHLTFAVGRDKPYQIKNLGRFASWMERGETVEYGRDLTLIHHRHSFAAESRPLLDFLLAEMADLAALPENARGNVGELRLRGSSFDRFFALMQGAQVTLRTPDGERRASFTEGHPTLTLTVEREGAGVRLFGDEAMPLYGARTLYLLHRGKLHRTGSDYTRRMGDWVWLSHRQPKGIYMAPDQLTVFCGGVLPTLRPYLHLQGDVAALDSHTAPTLDAEVRLDRLPSGQVTAQVILAYGGYTVASYDGTPAPWQDPLAELPLRLLLDRYFTGRLGEDTLVATWDDDTLFDFLTRGMDRLRQLARVTVTHGFDRTGLASAPHISFGVGLVEDVLRMTVDAGDLDPSELAGIIAGYRDNRPYHRLKDGRLMPLTDGSLAQLAELAEGLALSPSDLKKGQIDLPRYRALYLDHALRHRGLDIRRDHLFQQLSERHRQATQARYEVPASLQSVLRGYQRAGYRWLRAMEELGFGGILADDMGLGKTLQMIALMLAAKERGVTAPSLVVCPTSVVLGWEREIARFAPELSVLCIIGDAAERRRRLERAGDYDVVVTSYDILKRDVALYADLSFHYHVLDEAQYIKNSATQNARAVKAVRSVQRFALTGTPVENRLGELWSIFDFLMPGFLYSHQKFRSRFEVPITRLGDNRVLRRLGELVSPFILRRLKQQVLTELPPKTERVLPADMERPQRQVYLAAIADLRRQLSGSGKLSGRQRITVLTHLTRLRQICCDPRLCCEGYTGESGKLDACVELLREATAGGHKVLLFSQFTSMLSLIRERLEAEGIRYYVLQGSTPKEERARLVDDFNRDDTPVFLISLKAGGVGLNLTGADMVIHYDPWWNLAVENQATDRAHRIGQKNPVQVVRLIARDTIEEKILQMQESKWLLAEQVVGNNTPAITDLTIEELLELID